MLKVKRKVSDNNNYLYAVVLLVLFTTITAFSVYFITQFILDSFSDSNCMVMLITDAGIKSDDPALEANLTQATLGLKAVGELGLALGIGCLGIGVALVVRLYRLKPA